MRIPLTAKDTNSGSLNMTNESRTLYNYKKKLSLFGHIIRREALENVIETGKICGRRGSGR